MAPWLKLVVQMTSSEMELSSVSVPSNFFSLLYIYSVSYVVLYGTENSLQEIFDKAYARMFLYSLLNSMKLARILI